MSGGAGYKYWNRVGGVFVSAVRDFVSGCTRMIDETHDMIHNGLMFEFGQNNASLADNGTLLFEVSVPNGYEFHLKQIDAFIESGLGSIEIIKAPTIGTPGSTEVACVNMNGESSLTCPVTVYSDPASISGGTAYPLRYFAGGNPGSGPGAESSIELERVLEEGSTTVVRVTNLSGQARAVSAILHGYYRPE